MAKFLVFRRFWGEFRATYYLFTCPDFELYNLQHPTEKASIYAPRYYAMSQENASWVIQGLLVTIPPPSQQFCYEILKHDPELIDLLFKCAVVPRESMVSRTRSRRYHLPVDNNALPDPHLRRTWNPCQPRR